MSQNTQNINYFAHFFGIVLSLIILFFGYQVILVNSNANIGIKFLKNECYSTGIGMRWDRIMTATEVPFFITQIDLEIYDALGQYIETVSVKPESNYVGVGDIQSLSFYRAGLLLPGKCNPKPKNLVGYVLKV